MAGDGERINLRVPEQVEISYELAGLGSRFLAAFIDTSIVTIGVAVLAGLVWVIRAAATGQTAVSGLAALLVLSASLLLYVAYFIYYEVTAGGQSPGKRLVGLRVISVDGAPISPEQSAVRNILRIVDLLPSIYAVGMISILMTARNQRLGDLAAATIVVKERAEALPELPAEPPSVTVELPPGVSADVLRLVRAGIRTVTRDEEKTIRRFLERRFELAPASRHRLAARLADALRPRFPGLQVGQLSSPETFLEVILRALDERA